MQLPPEREGRPAPADVQAFRDGAARAIAAGVWRVAEPPEETTLAGVRVLRFRPGAAPRATVLHIHGGGFRIGCPEMLGRFAAELARRCTVEVVCPAYRLAPESPFPAGLADARKVFAALHGAGAGPIILSGDSAGGGLAAGLTALSAAEGTAPTGLVLYSPWLDLTVTSSCYAENAATDPLFSRASAEAAAELYLQGHSPRDPLASPLFAPLADFPPTFIAVGTGEVLAEDSRAMDAALRSAGAVSELLEVPDMEHTAATRDLALTGARETFDAAAAFIDRLLTPRDDG